MSNPLEKKQARAVQKHFSVTYSTALRTARSVYPEALALARKEGITSVDAVLRLSEVVLVNTMHERASRTRSGPKPASKPDALDDLLELIDRMDPKCESFLRLSWAKANEQHGPKDQIILELNTGERWKQMWVPIAVQGTPRADAKLCLLKALRHMLFNLPRKVPSE